MTFALRFYDGGRVDGLRTVEPPGPKMPGAGEIVA